MRWMTARSFAGRTVLVATLAFVWSCGEVTTSDPLADKAAPAVALSKSTAAVSDTTLAFVVQVTDNLGIKSVHVGLTGGLVAVYDTTFTTAVTDITIPLSFVTSRNTPAGTPVTVTASATDGAGNKSKTDTLTLTVGNVPPAEVHITSPATGSAAVVGKSILISISARTILKVRTVGFRVTGATTTSDSVIFGSPLRDTVSVLDTLSIPAGITPGTATVTPFVVDSLGQRSFGTPITLNIQSQAAINTVPAVSFGITKRAEVSDTIHVEASDLTGITTLGYEIRRTIGGAIDARDSIIANGTLTSQLKTFSMRLPYTTFPTTIYVQAFARNSNGVRSYAKLAGGGIDRIDTVTVVAGSTRPLPFGGLVADALYHPRSDKLYLTNILRNQLEVFSLADSTFKTPINVGSRPWGLAAWPRDRLGTMGDTLLVANSGGTDISYVNLLSGSTGREVRRYALPNIVVYSITTVTSQTSSTPIQQRTRYDFSDRPQFLAATCNDSGAPCGEVVLVYSTTPTAGQSAPFATRNGTIRWENLTRGVSHFFYEQAVGQSAGRADTLEIIREDANGINQTVLVPYKQTVTNGTESATISVVVQLPLIGFRDTTFVRNSGNFQRAVIGEGGSVLGSRAMTYDATRGIVNTFQFPSGALAPIPVPDEDLGVSRATSVSDFIANSFASVQGVAINFDGSLAGVRGDSTYVLNSALRLKGILPTTASNGGVDFHPANNGTNSFPLSTRLAFAASAQPEIEVYDTNCYQRVATVPIRDPIVGPIKAAIRPFSGQLVLVGATAQGVVIVTLGDTFTTGCP
jgi:hypothetical protein